MASRRVCLRDNLLLGLLALGNIGIGGDEGAPRHRLSVIDVDGTVGKRAFARAFTLVTGSLHAFFKDSLVTVTGSTILALFGSVSGYFLPVHSDSQEAGGETKQASKLLVEMKELEIGIEDGESLGHASHCGLEQAALRGEFVTQSRLRLVMSVAVEMKPPPGMGVRS